MKNSFIKKRTITFIELLILSIYFLSCGGGKDVIVQGNTCEEAVLPATFEINNIEAAKSFTLMDTKVVPESKLSMGSGAINTNLEQQINTDNLDLSENALDLDTDLESGSSSSSRFPKATNGDLNGADDASENTDNSPNIMKLPSDILKGSEFNYLNNSSENQSYDNLESGRLTDSGFPKVTNGDFNGAEDASKNTNNFSNTMDLSSIIFKGSEFSYLNNSAESKSGDNVEGGRLTDSGFPKVTNGDFNGADDAPENNDNSAQTTNVLYGFNNNIFNAGLGFNNGNNSTENSDNANQNTNSGEEDNPTQEGTGNGNPADIPNVENPDNIDNTEKEETSIDVDPSFKIINSFPTFVLSGGKAEKYIIKIYDITESENIDENKSLSFDVEEESFLLSKEYVTIGNKYLATLGAYSCEKVVWSDFSLKFIIK